MPNYARLESLIGFVSPSWAAKRSRDRLSAQLRADSMFASELADIDREYKNRRQARHRGQEWLASLFGPSGDTDARREARVKRSRELADTDPYAASALNGRVDNVVGEYVRPQARVRADGTPLSAETCRAINRRAEALFSLWAAFEDFAGTQRLLERSRARDGESLAVLSDFGDAHKPVPLRVDVIDTQRLRTPAQFVGDPNVVAGVRFRDGRPAVYYIAREGEAGASGKYDAYPADRVIHTFERVRAGQVRGVPWLAPVFQLLDDLHGFAEAHLIRARVEACIGVWIKKAGNPAEAAAANAVAGTMVEEIAPGTVNYIGAGDDVQTLNPSSPGGTFAPYVQHHLRAMAAALRYPYELLAKHYDNSFSGGRLSLIDGHVFFKCCQRLLSQGDLAPVWRRFMFEAVAAGHFDDLGLTSGLYVADPSPWERHDWQPTGIPWLSPKEEINADISAVGSGMASKTDRMALRGSDFEETLEKRTDERMAELEADARVEVRRRELATKYNIPEFSGTAADRDEDDPDPTDEPSGADRDREKETRQMKVAV